MKPSLWDLKHKKKNTGITNCGNHEAIPMGFETPLCENYSIAFVIMKPSLWDLKPSTMSKMTKVPPIMKPSLWDLKPSVKLMVLQCRSDHEAIPMGFETGIWDDEVSDKENIMKPSLWDLKPNNDSK